MSLSSVRFGITLRNLIAHNLCSIENQIQLKYDEEDQLHDALLILIVCNGVCTGQ